MKPKILVDPLSEDRGPFICFVVMNLQGSRTNSVRHQASTQKKNTVTNPKYAVPNIKNTILIIIIIRVASNCEVGILELYPSISNNASLHLESILCGRWWLPQRTLHSMPSTGVVTPIPQTETHIPIFPHTTLIGRCFHQ